MIEVSVEKLFSCLHFWFVLAMDVACTRSLTYICDIDKVLDDDHSALDVLLCKDHLCDPVRQLIGVENKRLDVCGRIRFTGGKLLLPCLVQALCRANLSV